MISAKICIMRTQSLPQDMYDSLFLSGQRKTLLLSYWSVISCLLLHCPNLVLLFWCEWWMLNLWFLSLWWLVNAEMSQYKRDYWWRKQQFERLRFTAYVLMVYALLVCIGYRGGCKDFLSGYMWEGMNMNDIRLLVLNAFCSLFILFIMKWLTY